MIKLLGNTRITKFNYFYMMCMMVYLGHATVFARSLGNLASWGNTFALIITAILIMKNRIKFDKTFFISIGVFLIYAAATTINNGLINPMWISQWIIWLTIAFCILKTFKVQLFDVYETILYQLCIVSLVFWILHIVFPSSLENICAVIQFSTPHGGENSNVASNVIFYTIGSNGTNEFALIKRNSGFAWEPGAFASYICLAIFCNSLRRNFSLENNKSLIIFVITLISTQSTAGFMIFIVMLITWLIINRKSWHIFVIIPIVLFLFRLPFVQEKMLEEYGNLESFDLSMTSDTNTYTLGRMASFMLDWQEFLLHPILGLGGWSEGTWLNQFGYDNISTISGIGELLAMYGAIMTILFFYLIFKSARLVTKTISKNGYLMLVAIIGMTISYSMWRHPIYMCFWLYGVYMVKKEIRKRRQDEDSLSMLSMTEKTQIPQETIVKY